MFKLKILPFIGNYWRGEENSILVIDNASVSTHLYQCTFYQCVEL